MSVRSSVAAFGGTDLETAGQGIAEPAYKDTLGFPVMPVKSVFSDQEVLFEPNGDGLWTVYASLDTIWSSTTPYQRAEIHLHPQFGKLLFLDGELQSATSDEFIYHESIVHPAMLSHPAPRRVAILGGGEGATAREVLRHRQVERVVMIDIDPEVVKWCREHLPEYSQGCFEDPRLNLVIGDAKAWMAHSQERFDVIISDLTEPSEDSPSFELFTPDFFALLKSRLSPTGVLAMQASNGNYGRLEAHCRIRNRLACVFSKLRSMLVHIPSFGCHWAFAVASDVVDPARLSADEIDRRLLERGMTGLSYYDGVTHQRIFALPRYARKAFRAPVLRG